MRSLERYTDYALVGALFWIGVFLMMALLNYSSDVPGSIPFKKLYDLILSKELNGPIIVNLLSGFGVAAVFITGMIVEIFSPVIFAPFELLYFKRNVIGSKCKNIESVFKADTESSIYNDYNLFRSTSIFGVHWWAQRRRYNILSSVLITSCLTRSEAGLLDELKDRLMLWRTGRALGGAIFLMALFVNCVLIVPSNPLRGLEAAPTMLGLWVVSGLLAMGQYTRVCTLVKAIVYSLK